MDPLGVGPAGGGQGPLLYEYFQRPDRIQTENPFDDACDCCIVIRDRRRPRGANGLANVLGWRIWRSRLSMQVAQAQQWPPISGGHPIIGELEAPLAVPPEVSTDLWPAWISDVRNLLERSRRTPRRRVRRTIERSITTYLHGEIDAQIREIHKRVKRASPPRPIGLDAPVMDPVLEEAAPILARRAARALQAGPWWWANPYRWTLQEHLQFAATQLWAVRVARMLDTRQTLMRHLDHLDWRVARVPYRGDPDTRAIIRGMGLDPGEQHGFPLSYNPVAIPLSDYLAHSIPTISPQIEGYLADLPPGPESLLLSSLLHHIAEETLGDLNDDELPFTYHWPPEERVLLSMAHWDVWPEGDTPRDRLAALLVTAAARLHPDDDTLLRPDELRQLLASAGVRAVGPRAV